MKALKALLALAMVFGCLSLPSAQVKAATLKSDADLQDNKTAEPEAWGVTPNANQYKYQKDELAMFVHFGMNTFTGKSWGDGTESESLFKLETFDAETLVKAAYDAGFKKVIVTAKHHDGFCIWESEYTEHDVTTSPYDGDVLAEISQACTKYDLDMGLYLSPWDVNAESYGYYDKDGNALCGADGEPLNGKSWDEVKKLDVLDYDDYYCNQLTEILNSKDENGNYKYGNNGKFVEIWMDGAKGSGSAVQYYDFTRWYETIQKYQGSEDNPCMVFQCAGYTTVHWIGNESGIAGNTTWSKIDVNEGNRTEAYKDNQQGAYRVGFENGNQWSVPECDAFISGEWFWAEHNKTPKKLSELADIYFNSVGHGATLLLNVPPNNQGKVDQAILDRLAEFGENIKETFDENLASDATMYADSVLGDDIKFKPGNVIDGKDETYWAPADGATSGQLVIDLDETTQFDVISIEEAIQLGQRIKEYKVEYSNDDGATWKTIQTGTTIGPKRLIRIPAVKADKVRITVSATSSSPIISEVGLFKASEGFALNSPIPEGLVTVDNTDKDTSDGNGFTYSGWYQENGVQYTNGTNMYATNGELTLTFKGSKVYLIGTLDPNHGTADIYIDGVKVDSINTYQSSRQVGAVIYESDDLTYGSHTLKLVGTGKAIGIEAAAVLDNDGKGAIEFEYATYNVPEDSDNVVTIKRIGGSKGEVSVNVKATPGSAVQGDFDANFAQVVTFADGEVEKTITIKTKRNTNQTNNQYFTLTVSQPTNGAVIGFNEKAKMVIKDYDTNTKDELQALYNSVKSYTVADYDGGWEAFAQWLSFAEAELAKEDGEYGKAYVNLTLAIEKLVEAGGYSEETPYVFPSEVNATNTLEVERSILENSGPANEQWKLEVATGDWASNGKFVNCINEGDKVMIPYTASVAGTYKVVLQYRSGATTNKLVWTDSNNNIVAGEQVAGNDDQHVTKTVEFNITINKAGSGVWTFTGPSEQTCQMDKMDITLVEVKAEVETLSDLVKEAQAIKADNYTSESFAKLTKAIEDAQAVLAKENPTADEVNDAIAALTNAINTLQAKAIDESTLINTEANKNKVSVIAKTSEADSDYATNVLDYNNQTKWHSDWGASATLPQSISFDLGKVYNLTDVTFIPRFDDGLSGSHNGDILKAKIYVSEDNNFTDEDLVGTFEWAHGDRGFDDRGAKRAFLGENVSGRYVKFEAIETFGADTSNKYASMAEIRFYGTSDEVDPVVVDKTALNTAISEANKVNKADYTDESVINLEAALSDAEAIRNKDDATQTEVDAATKALNNAISALVKKPVVNKAELEKAIKDAEKVDTTNKTAESIAALTSAITSAKEVLADEKATQDAVDAAVKAVNAAVANLKDVEVKPDPKPEYKGYDDVDSEAWYAGMVEEATIKGLMGKDGNVGNNFNPDGKITRGMVATVLYRMAGEPKVTYADKFSDVKDGLWYSNGIVWASEVKVVSGYANGKFGPDDAIKREDFAIMLRNYANTCGLDTKSSQSLETFKDYKAVSAYAKDAIAWCVENGLMSGSKKGEETYLNPSANTTRAEAAKMFVQLSNLIKK